MANIKDVAKKAGVSVSTVSYALNDSKEISNVTKNKIKKIADELGYVPSSYARSLKLKSKQSFRIGVFVPGFGGPIHPMILNGLANIFEKSKYNMVAALANNDLYLIKDKSVDLAILMDPRISYDSIKAIENICPIIIYDKDIDDERFYTVKLQNMEGIYNETKYFISLGVKKIAFMYGPHNSQHNKERFDGYKKAMEEANLQTILYDAGSYVEERGYDLMNEILSNPIEFDAIICSNDELAIGSIRSLVEHGYNVPEDCLVGGFDNNEKSKLIEPSLTTIDVNYYECGENIAKMALDILSHNSVPKTMIVPAKLIKRNSTKRWFSSFFVYSFKNK